MMLLLLFNSVFVSAQDFSLTADKKVPGKPFQELWDQVEALWQELSNMELTPAPEGPQGEMGPQGIQGDQGLQGGI